MSDLTPSQVAGIIFVGLMTLIYLCVWRPLSRAIAAADAQRTANWQLKLKVESEAAAKKLGTLPSVLCEAMKWWLMLTPLTSDLSSMYHRVLAADNLDPDAPAQDPYLRSFLRFLIACREAQSWPPPLPCTRLSTPSATAIASKLPPVQPDDNDTLKRC